MATTQRRNRLGQFVSSNGSSDPLYRAPNDLMSMIANAMLSRKELVSGMLDPRRNINHECGYPETENISPEDYRKLYDREPIAARLVEVLPRESWQVQPNVVEDEDVDNPTAFEEAWDSLDNSLRGTSWYQDELGSPIWEALLRADVLSGVGRFGVILLGFDDGLELDEPVAGVNERGIQEPEPGKDIEGQDDDRPQFSPTHKLLFLRSFDESLVNVDRYEKDINNPRYGQPIFYNLQLSNPDDTPTNSATTDSAEHKVHWSRVIHLADNLRSSEVFAVPRMQPSYNRLLDLRKLYSGSAEMYWKGAFPGLSLEVHPELAGSAKIDRKDLKDQMEQYMNGLQRWLYNDGMTVKSIAPQVSDPTAQINVQIEAICIQQGIPKRVFTGSERGELASSQDDSTWNDRLRTRQNCYITPKIIVPFIDRLIAVGVLPVPEGYSVKWPDLDSLSEQEQAIVALTRTEALAKYIQGSVEAIIEPMDYLVRELSYTEEEAKGILEAALKHSEEVVDEEAEEAEMREEIKGEVMGDMKAEAAQARAFQQLEPSANVSREEIDNEFEDGIEEVTNSLGLTPIEREVLRADCIYDKEGQANTNQSVSEGEGNGSNSNASEGAPAPKD